MKPPPDDALSLSDDEILDMPEDNLPVNADPELRNRREAAKQIKETELVEENLHLRHVHARHDREDAQAFHLLTIERFQAAMEDIRYREDLLLKQVDRQEKLARKHLREIEDRAIELRDGRHAYLGTHGDFLDDEGRVIEGADRDEAIRKYRDNPNVSTYAERIKTQQRVQGLSQIKQDIIDAREQRRSEDKGKLSDDEMISRTAERTASLARMESRFHETLSMTDAGADQTYGSTDYMASFDDAGRTGTISAPATPTENGGTLTREFSPAAEGQGSEKIDKASHPEVDSPSTNPSPSF